MVLACVHVGWVGVEYDVDDDGGGSGSTWQRGLWKRRRQLRTRGLSVSLSASGELSAQSEPVVADCVYVCACAWFWHVGLVLGAHRNAMVLSGVFSGETKPVYTAQDKVTNPRDWLFAIKLWDDNLIPIIN